MNQQLLDELLAMKQTDVDTRSRLLAVQDLEKHREEIAAEGGGAPVNLAAFKRL